MLPDTAPLTVLLAVPLGAVFRVSFKRLLAYRRGLSWVRLATGVEVELHAAAFADRERGFVVGEGGVALWTEDGGRSWGESKVER